MANLIKIKRQQSIVVKQYAITSHLEEHLFFFFWKDQEE